MPAPPAAPVEHAIDGRLAQARLERDFLDEKGVSHGRRLDGFLMGRRNNLAGLRPYTETQKQLHEGKLMKDDNAKRLRANRVWLTADSCDLEEFKAQVERSLNRADYPFASNVVSNVLVYDGLEARKAAASPESRKELLAEWVDAFTDGPGIIVIRNAFPEHAAIDKSNAHYWAIIDEERLSNVGGGDHFAKPGANDRIWNALEKLCLRDPAVFASYYGNAIIALVSEAWLGPSYQITSQLNVVNPGGAGRAPRLSSGLPVGGSDRALSRPRPAALAGADTAGRGRALRHANRDRTDALSAVLAGLPARLYGDGAAGVSRLFRQASCPAAARQGRRGVLQPGALPRGGDEPLEGRAPHRQPAAGLLGLRPRDGKRRPAQDEPETLSGAERSSERSGDQCGRGRQRCGGDRGRLFFPDQSRPRPAERRHGAEVSAGLDAPGAQGELAAGCVRRRGGSSGQAEADLRPAVAGLT